MKVYIKSATNVSDIQAKIAKKRAEIDKKRAWIQKKEDAITKKLDLLSGKISDADLSAISRYVEALKTTRSHKVPQELYVDMWGLARKYGYTYEDAEGKALYNLDDDAESIFNSNAAIKEAQGILDKYSSQLDAIKAKGEEIDKIPECLKEFMNDIIEQWDEYDIALRDSSQPYYRELKKDADEILFADNPTRSFKVADYKLQEMYPDIPRSWDRSKQFDDEYIYIPFRKKFGQTVQYCTRLWSMSDGQIHVENQKAGESLILDLLKRVTKVTGPVRDWSGLHVTQGNGGFAVLNGVVIGEDGKARVESIYASGSIQRLHVRTLVKPIK